MDSDFTQRNADSYNDSTRLLYLTKKDIDKIINSIKDIRDQLFIALLYEMGCTLNELLNIRIRDIDFEKNSITITGASKTKRKHRVSYISERSKRRILSYVKQKGLAKKRVAYLFESSHGGHMTTRRVNQIIKNMMTSQGFEDKASPQVIKYSHIVNAYLSNVPISAIRKQVGMTKNRLIAILNEIEVEDIKGNYTAFFER